ncbi:hypothetical protein ACPF4J_002617 [Vibrio cholerae]
MKFKKQSGFGLLTALVSVVATSLLFFLFVTNQSLSLRAERERWILIASTPIHMLDAYENYFNVDCSDDGVVTPRDITFLYANGYIKDDSIFNPFDFQYSVSFVRPSTRFDSAGRVISDGFTEFTITTTINDDYKRSRFTYALEEMAVPFDLMGKSIAIRKTHNLTDTELNYQYLNGGMGFNCY